jgi:hypothetical protein
MVEFRWPYEDVTVTEDHPRFFNAFMPAERSRQEIEDLVIEPHRLWLGEN